LTQIYQRTPDKEIIIILENASIHKSKRTKKFLETHKNIHLFYLPPYSPEYNPVELFWKWIKPKVYGFTTIGGLNVLVKKFRKIVWNYNENRMPNPISFKLNAYAEIL